MSVFEGQQLGFTSRLGLELLLGFGYGLALTTTRILSLALTLALTPAVVDVPSRGPLSDRHETLRVGSGLELGPGVENLGEQSWV